MKKKVQFIVQAKMPVLGQGWVDFMILDSADDPNQFVDNLEKTFDVEFQVTRKTTLTVEIREVV